jgi:hypothetical protein
MKYLITLLTLFISLKGHSQTCTHNVEVRTIIAIQSEVFAEVAGTITIKVTSGAYQYDYKTVCDVKVKKYYTDLPEDKFNEPTQKQVCDAVIRDSWKIILKEVKEKCQNHE